MPRPSKSAPRPSRLIEKRDLRQSTTLQSHLVTCLSYADGLRMCRKVYKLRACVRLLLLHQAWRPPSAPRRALSRGLMRSRTVERPSGLLASKSVVPALVRCVRFQRHAGSGRNLDRSQLELPSRQSSTCHSIGDAPKLCTSVLSSCSSLVHRLGTASGRRRFSFLRDSGCALRVAALPVPPPRPTPVCVLRLCSYPPRLPPILLLLLALQLLPLLLPRLAASSSRCCCPLVFSPNDCAESGVCRPRGAVVVGGMCAKRAERFC